jgi:S1-C subfamily serine protease
MARQVMDQLVNYGEIKRGRIGVAMQDLTPDIAQALGTTRSDGAVIARVEPGSPAERAGLRTNDLIVAVNGAPIRNGAELRDKIVVARIGDEVDLTIARGSSERTVAVRIDQVAAQRQRVRQR